MSDTSIKSEVAKATSMDSLSSIEDKEQVLNASVPDSKEANWIVKIKNDDYAAFEALFDAYQNKIMSFINLSLSNTSDTEELTQEVFLKVWINRKSINPSQSFKAYIFTMAKNVVYDFLRKKLNQKKYVEAVSKELANDNSNIETLYYNEALDLINKLVDELPPKCQQIFKMNRFEGKSYKSIASSLNISENTVDTQIRKALNFLRKNYPHITKMLLLFI